MRDTEFSLARRGVIIAVVCAALFGTPFARVSADVGAGQVSDVLRPETPPGPAAVHFEPNRGQLDARAEFRARSPGYDTFLSGGEAVIALAPDARGGRAAVRMHLVGGRSVEGRAGERLSGRSHYLRGGDRAEWVRDVPHHRAVRYPDVRPGIDLLYRGARRDLRFDLEVAPGAAVDDLCVAWDGASALHVDARGALLVRVGARELEVSAPIAYQPAGAARDPVPARWVAAGDDVARIVIGAHDRSRPLVIDPTLKSSTYLAGSLSDTSRAIAVNGDGEVLVAATTLSTDFPTTVGAYAESAPTPGTSGTQYDVVVTKFAEDRESLEFSTYLGGNSSDQVSAIAVDGSGRAVICGSTFSSNFPLVDAYSEDVTEYSSEAFLLQLEDDGSDIVWSTFLGDDVASADALVLDGSDQPHVLATKSTFDGASVIPGMAVLKVDADGQDIDFSTRIVLTSSSNTSGVTGSAIALDTAGNVFVAGYSAAWALPTTSGAYQRQLPGYNASNGSNQPGSGFVFKLSSTGTVSWGTWLGGAADDERIYDLAVAGDGKIVVTGFTDSSNFPLVNDDGTEFDGRMAFLTWIASDGASLARSTFFGGSGSDAALALEIDASGDLHVAGSTTSDDFPVTDDAYADERTGVDDNDRDAWLARLSSTGALEFGTYLGSAGSDSANGIALDCGRVHLVGTTSSDPDDLFPTLNAYSTSHPGSYELFVATFETPHTIAVDDLPVPEWTVGRAFARSFAVEGHADEATWTRTSGTLPPGMTFSADGELSGTPTTSGTTSLTIKALSSCGSEAFRTFDLVVNPRPAIDRADELGWTVGRAFSFALEIVGGTGDVDLVPGELPAWLELSETNVLSGTAYELGSVHFDVTLTDERGAETFETVTFTTNPEPAISTGVLEDTTERVYHEWTLAALGGTAPFTWTYEGASSPGVYTMNAADGVLRGRPGTAGDHQVSVALVDASGARAQGTVDLHVNPYPDVTPFVVPVGAVGRPFELQLRGSGGTPAGEWSSLGALPSGLRLDAATGMLDGTPTVVGTTTRELVYRDARGAEASQTVDFVVAERFALDAKRNKLDLDIALLGSERTRHHFLELQRGTQLSVKLAFKGKGKKKSKGPFPYDVAFLGSDGVEIPLAEHAKEGKRTFAIKKLSIAETGRYVLRLTPDEPFEGKVSIAVSAKPAKSWSGDEDLSAAGTTEVSFPVLAGSTLGFQVKAAKKSAALPEIIAITQGGEDLLAGAKLKTKGKSSKVTVRAPTAAGEVIVTFAARDGPGGPASWKATVKSPKIYGLELPELPSAPPDDS